MRFSASTSSAASWNFCMASTHWTERPQSAGHRNIFTRVKELEPAQNFNWYKIQDFHSDGNSYCHLETDEHTASPTLVTDYTENHNINCGLNLGCLHPVARERSDDVGFSIIRPKHVAM
jgi:hypothetical protein